ncbi:MAG: ABC transporter permease [Bacteroidota bacterium]
MTKNNNQPPAWADRLLEWYCDPLLVEDLQGDLYERFSKRVNKSGRFKAKILYIWDVLRFIKPYTLKGNQNSLNPSTVFMWSNYFKTSYRSLAKEKVNSSVSILGLALGLSAFILISLYVNDELKYDTYLPNAQRIYRITMSFESETSSEHSAWSEPSVGPLLKAQYPEVESYTALVNETNIISSGELTFNEELFFLADTNYFKVFPYHFTHGKPSSFSAKTIVLTTSIAKKYFEDVSDAMNQTLSVNGREHTIVGIIRDLPAHTDLKFDAIIGMDKITEWTFNYVLFKNEIAPEDFQPKLDKTFAESVQIEFDDYNTKGQYHMEALPDVHFGSAKLFDTPKSSKANLYLFTVVALLILIIASINHLNLSLASISQKQTEVGIRKAIGAQNHQLRAQFLLRSLILCFVSLFLAVGVVIYCLPYLNVLTDKQMEWTGLFSPTVIIYLLITTIGTSLLSGSYPAFYLANANPIKSLKGNLSVDTKSWLRKSLIVFQFTTSMVLIIATFLISRQMDLIQEKSSGNTNTQVLIINVPKDKTLLSDITGLKKSLADYSFVQAVSAVGYNSWPTNDTDVDAYEVRSKGKWQTVPINNVEVDEGYLNTLDLKLAEGRFFKPEETKGAYDVVIVNQALVNKLGWKNPLEQYVTYESGIESRVIGVIEDFHFKSLRDPVEPMLIFPDSRYPDKLMIKIDTKNWLSNTEELERHWKSVLSDQPFEFQFLDQYVQRQYKSEQTMRTLFNYFVLIAVSIACLGLFGLIGLSTANRIQEVGIRKVLGAKMGQLWLLLTKDFIVLILFASLLAIPLAVLFMNNWLSNFVYRTPMSLDIFLVSMAVVLTVALLTMSFHVIKAANTSPSKVLKNE